MKRVIKFVLGGFIVAGVGYWFYVFAWLAMTTGEKGHDWEARMMFFVMYSVVLGIVMPVVLDGITNLLND